MKILQLTTAYIPSVTYGGPVWAIHYLNKALIKAGIEVLVITTTGGLRHEDKKVNLQWHDVEGIPVKYFPYYFYDNFKFSPQLLFALISEVGKFDLVHINSIWDFNMWAGCFVSQLFKKPYIVSSHGSLYQGSFGISNKFIKIVYYNIFLKQFIKHTNALCFTTNNEMENVASLVKLPDNKVVIPNGIDLSLFQNLPDKGVFKKKYGLIDKKYILFLGRIHKQKGIKFLLEAFKQIQNTMPDIYLVIAGFDQRGYIKEIQKWINENDLSNKVIFTGLLTGKEKLAAYKDADVFVLSSYFESFGMTVVEAMGCGVPIIISDKVGIRDDVLQYDAGIVTPLDSSHVAKAIKSILNDQALAIKLAQNGHRLLEEKYDIRIVAKQMISAYREICKIN